MTAAFHQVKDQMGYKIQCPQDPQRIISLVPSQTELLFDLGLEDRIVGISKFCIHPKDKVKQYPKIGGTKKFNFEKIIDLKPDLIIGNKEENYQEGIEVLKKDYPVWVSDIVTLQDSTDMINRIGELTNTSIKADLLIDQINTKFESIQFKSFIKALYLIWQRPYMVAGVGTFIHEMLPYAGFENLINETRYPELTDEEIKKYNPEYILLSSEPYPFQEKHIKTFRELCPQAKVILVDGEMFSWYGSRLRYAPEYFKNIIKPG